MNANPARPITHDPLFYMILALFAAMTTAVGVVIGSPWFLTFVQTTALWIFALAAFRRRSVGDGVRILALWCAVQFVTFFSLTLALAHRAELALGNGFLYREAMLEWLFTGSSLPASWAVQPLARAAELLGVTVGALLTAGLVGVWFLMRMVNLYAFGAAVTLYASGSLIGLVGGLAPWMFLRIVGSIGSIAVLSLVGFTGEWSPSRWPATHRRLLWLSLGLLAASILLELLLPGPWSHLFGALLS